MLPIGWAVHPQNPQYMYELANPQNVQQIPAAAPPQPPVPQQYAQPAAAQAPSAAAHVPGAGQAAMDFEKMQRDYEALKSSGSGKDDFIWIDFESTKRAGDETHLTLRLLPHLDGCQDYVEIVRHRVPADLLPPRQDGSTQRMSYPTCPNGPRGPGGCAICEAVETIIANGGSQAALDMAGDLKGQVGVLWQVLNLGKINEHYVQVKDTAGLPLVDAAGQPMWKIVPGVIRVSRKMHRQIIHLLGEKKLDAAHPINGAPLRLTRQQTGPLQMNVEYHVLDLPPSPLDAALHPVFPNRVSLEEKVLRFAQPEYLRAIAGKLMAKASASAAPVYPPNPQYGYAPQYAPQPPQMAPQPQYVPQPHQMPAAYAQPLAPAPAYIPAPAPPTAPVMPPAQVSLAATGYVPAPAPPAQYAAIAPPTNGSGPLPGPGMPAHLVPQPPTTTAAQVPAAPQQVVGLTPQELEARIASGGTPF